jgi:glycosyltransferase involved in cell wall biosynthesis
MEKRPLVSAIVTVYNSERYLADAISSIVSQTYRPIEVIVIDDGSTDGSAAIAGSFPEARYYFQPNAGPGAARNRGVELSQGSFLAFLDADDVWTKEKLARQMAAFENNPSLDMVFGEVEQFHSPELNAETVAKLVLPDAVRSGLLIGALLMRRDSFGRVGPFASNWRVGEFVDWYAKAMEQGLQSRVLPEVLLRRRLHTTNLSLRERSARTDYARIMKASLDRRRGKESKP